MALEAVGSSPIIHPNFLYTAADHNTAYLWYVIGIPGAAAAAGEVPRQWDVAKSVRHGTLTPAFRRFESCHPSQLDPLAQPAEHLPFKQGVPRSNRGWITKATPQGVRPCGVFV